MEGEAHGRKDCKTGDSQEEQRAQRHLYGRPHNPPGDSSELFEAPERNVGIGKSGRVRRGVAGARV